MGVFPRACNAYTECAGLVGDCCPDAQNKMLDCCVQGSIRMNAEDLKKEADAETAAAATKVAKANRDKAEAQAKVDEAAAFVKNATAIAKYEQAQVEKATVGSSDAQKAELHAKAKANEDAAAAQAASDEATREVQAATKLSTQLHAKLVAAQHSARDA